VSIIAGLTSTVLFAAAYQFQTDQEPTRLLAAGATSAELLRWGSVLDLFGFYLATAVLAYVLWRQLRPRNPLLADLSTMAGLDQRRTPLTGNCIEMEGTIEKRSQ
jgi:hypothetical protein